jgi:hypothetical protein
MKWEIFSLDEDPITLGQVIVIAFPQKDVHLDGRLQLVDERNKADS